MKCRLISLEPLSPFVHRACLQPEQAVNWQPGQYLQLNLDDGDKRFFSIASIAERGVIELHIGAAEHDGYAYAAIEYLQQHGSADIELPLGRAFLRQDSPHPIILLAGGTGFAYAKAIAESLLASGVKREVYLYWGSRNEQAMYLGQLPQQWAVQHPHFHFVPVIEHPSDSWNGRRGLVHKAVIDDFISLQSYEIYAAGRFDMVGKAREDFLGHGLVAEQMYSDAFEFI